MEIRGFEACHLPAMRDIWNQVVEAGDAFPQTEPLTEAEAPGFFAGQSFSGVALKGREVLGLYILHPNNVVRRPPVQRQLCRAVRRAGAGRRRGPGAPLHG